MPTYTQSNRSARIETPFGKDVLLLKSFTGTEGLGKPFQYDLVMASEDPELDYEKIIGQKVTITVETAGHAADGGAVTRYFHGFVSRFAQTNYEGKLAEYRATVVPWLWFLTRSANCRIFQNLKVPDILTQVFKDFGFSDLISQLHGNYRTWSYCVQYRETAYHFVSRLMEEEGIYYYFKHENGKHSLVLCDSPASHQDFPGYTELLYRPTAEGVEETLRSWSVQHEVQSDAYATNNFNFTAPKAYSVASSFENRGYGPTKLEQFDYLGEQSEFDEYSTGAPNENDRYSLMRLQELQAGFETYAGESDARGICTGSKFILKGHPRKTFEKEYLTTGADYQIETNPFETVDEYGKEFKYQVKLTAMLLTVPFRSPRVTPKPIVHGPQTATVVGPAGEKISTDQYGQVKVQFHWDRLGKNDQNSSCYMRVSQGWAGKNWGDMAIPHVGDEVIVECLEGDPDRPIITGRVYNNANMPPLALPDNQHKRTWKDDYGNELTFDATPGDEHILLRSPHHNSGLTLGRSACTWTESNVFQATNGDALNMHLGMQVDLMVGAYSMPILGTNVGAVVGANFGINFATQAMFNFGPQFLYSRGLKHDDNGDDVNKICDKNMVISAGGVLNLVGGAGPIEGTSIMWADDNVFELTVGNGTNVSPISQKLWAKGTEIATLLLPIVAATMMGAGGAYVDAYNTTASSPTTADEAKKKTEDALDSQKDWWTAAGVVQAVSLVAMIINQALASKAASATVPVYHEDDTFTARLKLDKKKSTAILEGKEVVRLWGGNDNAMIALDADGVSIGAANGNIEISVGTTGVAIKNGEITIEGPNVKVKGNFDVGDGALTVMGAPVALLNQLETEKIKRQVGDLANNSVRKLLVTSMAARRAASGYADE